MVLCIGIVEDGLSRKILNKNYIDTDNPFVLERHELYRRGAVFNAGVLYIAKAEALPSHFIVQEGASLLCVGMPPEAYGQSSLRLLVLDESTDLLDLINEVSNIFFEYNTLEQKLQDSVNKGRSIQYMVEQMAPYLNGNEMLVCNDEYRMIGQSNKIVHMNEISGLGQPDSEGFLPPEIVTYFKNDVVFERVRNRIDPFMYESRIFKCRAIDMNVFHQGEYVCRVVIAEDRHTFRGYEAGLLSFFTSFIQLVYDLSGDSGKMRPRDHMTEIFIDLLNGETIEEYRIENSYMLRGWQQPGPFLCAAILPSDRDYYHRTISYYCQVFNRDIPGGCFFEHSGVIICVADLAHYAGVIDQFVSANIETFRDGYFRIGYSNVFKKISELKHYCAQAKIALDIGNKQYPSIWFHKFSNIALEYLKSKMTEELDGRYLCASEILLLHDYDKLNQTDLLLTIRTYLGNQMNAIKTAGDLYIHRSTMVYRLERIKELTGIDFKDADKMLYLALSLNLLFQK